MNKVSNLEVLASGNSNGSSMNAIEAPRAEVLNPDGSLAATPLGSDTVNGLEDEMERQRFIAAIREGERDVQAGRVQPVEQVMAELKAKYGF